MVPDFLHAVDLAGRRIVVLWERDRGDQPAGDAAANEASSESAPQVERQEK